MFHCSTAEKVPGTNLSQKIHMVTALFHCSAFFLAHVREYGRPNTGSRIRAREWLEVWQKFDRRMMLQSLAIVIKKVYNVLVVINIAHEVCICNV